MSQIPTIPLSTQFFAFRTMLDSAGQSYGLAVQDANNVVLMSWQGGVPSELWQIVPNGDGFSIQSALSTSSNPLYLNSDELPFTQCTVSSNSQAFTLPAGWINLDGGTSTLPDYQTPGQFISPHDMTIAVYQATAGEGAHVVVAAPSSNAPEQLWQIFPVAPTAPRAQWSFIASVLKDSGGSPLVLDLANPAQFDTTLVLSHPASVTGPSPAVPRQMWQMSPQGLILNGVGYVMANGEGNNTQGFVAGTLIWNPANTPGELWTLNDAGMIVSSTWPNLALQIDSAEVGSGLQFAPIPEGATPQTMLFQLLPPPVYSEVLALPPAPFPQFTDTQAEAYASINEQLGVSDLRTQYLDVNAVLDLQSNLAACKQPSGVDLASWTAVMNQLSAEVEGALGVVIGCAMYNMVQTTLQSRQQSALTTLISDASIDSDTQTTGIALQVYESVFFTGVSLVPAAGAVVSLARAGIDAALAVNRISAAPFQAQVSDVWTQISAIYAGILDQIQIVQTVLLSDWGKLQAINNSILQPLPAPGSVNGVDPIFRTAAMQILMPAQYQLYTYQDDDSDPVPGMSDELYAQNVAPTINAGVWQKTWIAEGTDWDTYPSAQAMSDALSATGGSWFVEQLWGWPLPVSWVYHWNGAAYNTVVITVTNQSPVMMTLSIPGQSVQLPAYQSASVMPAPGDTNMFNVTIADGLTGATYGTFEAFASPATVLLQHAAPGYALSAGQCYPDAYQAGRDGYPAAVQVTITRV